MTEMNTSSDQELRRLNEEIRVKEQAGEVPFFDELLADNFLFRRADGTFVDKHHYLEDLESVAKNPYERLETVVENVPQIMKREVSNQLPLLLVPLAFE